MLVTISRSWQTSVLIYLLLSFYYKDTESSDYRTRYWKANTNIVKRDLTRKGVPELRGPANLVCVLIFLMGQNPKCIRRVLLPPPSPVLATFIQYLPTMYLVRGM